MKRIIKWIYNLLRGCLLRIKSFVRLIVVKSFVSSDSYYPEFKDRRRSKLNIFWMQLVHIAKYGVPNQYFFACGLDIKQFHQSKDYISNSIFIKKRNFLNRWGQPDSSIALLRNKFLFGLVANELGIPHPEEIGLIQYDQLYLFGSRQTVNLEHYLSTTAGDAFMKMLNGECGNGVYHLKYGPGQMLLINGEKSEYADLKKITCGRKFILQRSVRQIQAIADLYPHALNTMRIITVFDRQNERIEILPPVMRIGANGNCVDNWAAGGLIVSIDVTSGCLSKYGFFKPTIKVGKCAQHPDTLVHFEGYKIPYFEEAIALCKKFHSYFTDIHSIGWDIAITENGPCFIEGNDNWDTVLPQVCSRGLKPEFDKYFLQ